MSIVTQNRCAFNAPTPRPEKPFRSGCFVNMGHKPGTHEGGAITISHPTRNRDWANEFCHYLTRRYRIERESWNTFFPDLDSPEGQLERMADIAATSATFDLNDGVTKSYFLEFLVEHRERVDWWRRFQLVYGPCHLLEAKGIFRP